MPLPRPVAHCPICGDKVIGRKDKIFCSPNCKAEYHYRRKKQRVPVSEPIDSILHRNWVILTELYEEIGKKKFFVSRAKLNKSGFHTRYFTSYELNSKGKAYRYIYDFGWMEFSDKELMVIKLAKPK